MAAKKVHLESAKGGAGGRSACRYTSRPSRRVRLLPLDAFLATRPEDRCGECSAAANVHAEAAKNQSVVSMAEHMKELGYAPEPQLLVVLTGNKTLPTGKTYRIKDPGLYADPNHSGLEVIGHLPYLRAHGPSDHIEWFGLYTEAEGLKVISVDAMVAPSAIMSLLGVEGLSPRVTFKSGIKENGDSKPVLEDLMPLVSALDQILKQD